MALITPTATINAQTGKITYSFTGVATADTLKAVVIRPKMCKGASMLPNALTVTVADGSVTQITLGGSDPETITDYTVRPAATFVYSADSQAEQTLKEGIDFTIGNSTGTTPKQINFSTALTGANKVCVLNYSYYDVVGANLVYDTPIYPSNCRGVMTQTVSNTPYNIIIWNEGILAQEPKFVATAGTVNAVVEALITDA